MNNLEKFPKIDSLKMRSDFLDEVFDRDMNDVYGNLLCYTIDKIRAIVRNDRKYECKYCREYFLISLKGKWSLENEYNTTKSELVKFWRKLKVYMWLEIITRKDSYISLLCTSEVREWFESKELAFSEKLGYYLK
tara:strand:- start:47 stop:451 length:405 start_codon:yes stop_codon:yes gene_type:complete